MLLSSRFAILACFSIVIVLPAYQAKLLWLDGIKGLRDGAISSGVDEGPRKFINLHTNKDISINLPCSWIRSPYRRRMITLEDLLFCVVNVTVILFLPPFLFRPLSR
ncbi:hypothetical protein F4776DRAFT_564248 [Hypoxylon sp. NC0597]|nr:hypothetical protein F4776DRAFT_564248 [Hypoxylon sp. NC0597]